MQRDLGDAGVFHIELIGFWIPYLVMDHLGIKVDNYFRAVILHEVDGIPLSDRRGE